MITLLILVNLQSNFNLNFSGFFSFINVYCQNITNECRKLFRYSRFPRLIYLKSNVTDYNERISKKHEINFLDKNEIFEDLQIEFESEIKDITNATIARSSLDSRRKNKFPVYYFLNEVIKFF